MMHFGNVALKKNSKPASCPGVKPSYQTLAVVFLHLKMYCWA